MRTLAELTEGETLWTRIEQALRSAKHARVLPASSRGPAELLALQVTVKCALGAIAYQTAGILLNGGWLRMLGSGSDDVASSLGRWNGLVPGTSPLIPGALVVAWDAVGGVFVINDTALAHTRGNICYLAPDDLEWFDMQMGHGQFVQWACTDRVDEFYRDLRWPGWEGEVALLTPDQGLQLYPPPWSKEGKHIERVHRSAVPALELMNLSLQYWDQVALRN